MSDAIDEQPTKDIIIPTEEQEDKPATTLQKLLSKVRKAKVEPPHPDLTDPKSFERYKHHLVPTKELLELEDQPSIVDNVELPKQKKIKEYITLVKPGKTRIVKVDRINAQLVQIRDEVLFGYDLKKARVDKETKKKEKYIVKQYFTMVSPILQYDTTGKKTKVRIMHFAYEDEPFTRNWWGMDIADHDKKWEKLLQLGVAIRDDDLDALLKYFVMADEEGTPIFDEVDVINIMYRKSRTGYYIVPEWAGYDVVGAPRIKYNTEDITYMKEEIYHALSSDIHKDYTTAMLEDPFAKQNKMLQNIILIMLGAMVLLLGETLYFLSGHLH